MNWIFPASSQPKHVVQSRLMTLAAGFILATALALTLSPAVRLHSWSSTYRWAHWLGVAVWLGGFMLLHRQQLRWLPEHDPYLLPAVALLSGWGLLTIWRLDEELGLRQTIWLLISMAVFGGLLRVPRLLARLRRYKYLWLVLGLALTALTFIIGTYPGGVGPRLWLELGGMYFQPSEPLKLLLVIYLAAFLADQLTPGFNLFYMLTPTLVMAGTSLAVLIAQRDMGTTMIFLGLYAGMVFIASGHRGILAFSAMILVAGGLAGYQFIPVIHQRIDTWLNPWADPAGQSFQVIQSLISVASGGIFGTGPGLGSPGVVPVAHSDFIFSAISEEFGQLGAVAFFVILALFAGRGLVAALRARSSFQRFLAAGLTFYLVGQSLVIITGNLGALPLTGVTLPFVSYGGSSLLTSFLSFFLIQQVSSRGEEEGSLVSNPRPYVIGGSLVIGGIALIALIAGWWGVVRSSELQSRQDNPRWSIIQRYVKRGTILDHNNEPLAITTGQRGGLQRQVTLPSLGPVIGYTHPLYGQAGLEASLDGYLRGLQGTPTSSVLLYQLFFAQTPPGNDVRLSLDLNIQKMVDQQLNGKTAALVLLNARSGEILAMASHPYFDPNQLDAQWDFWMKNERSIFLNRATQGIYPPGSAMGPFLFSQAITQARLPAAAPEVLSTYLDQRNWTCSFSTPARPAWGAAIANGCPGAVLLLGSTLPGDSISHLYTILGFDQTPQIPLPVAEAGALQPVGPDKAALGQANISVSPLQMALAAAMLSNHGIRPSPSLATAVQTPNQGWVVLPAALSSGPILNSTGDAANALQMENLPAWSTTALAHNTSQVFTWFIGGTLPSWQGTPLAMALVLEEENPPLARQIGEDLLQSLLYQK